MARSTQPSRIYRTALGVQYAGSADQLLKRVASNSVDLIVTSPPFALLREKTYGNQSQANYVDWLARFGRLARRVLKDSGSMVIDLGGAYQQGKPVRSLYNYRVLLKFCDSLGYHLAEEFFWYNPAKLPSPAEWVNKRKIRVKDAINPLWWFSKSENPKADATRVRVDYSPSMQALLRNPDSYYQPGDRPSQHRITRSFGIDNGGALPSNLLQIANTDSSGPYLRMCRLLDQPAHPARFPAGVPQFFVRFLTEPGDVVLDIFSGSNTTGWVAEQENRRWLSFELVPEFARLSALRFLEGRNDQRVADAWGELSTGTLLDLSDAPKSVLPAEDLTATT